MAPTITVRFADFWPGFDPLDNWFIGQLRQHFEVTVRNEADLMIYSCYGQTHREWRGRRLYVSFENRGWGFSRCDAAATSDRLEHQRHLRLPLWAVTRDELGEPVELDEVAAVQRPFASMVISAAQEGRRSDLVEAVRAVDHVASGGRWQNNVGGPVPDKLAFIQRYKFHLAFENSSYPGYSTEKLWHGLHACTVPLYWGDPTITTEFNRERIISVHDHPTMSSFLGKVRSVHEDSEHYLQIIHQPWFSGAKTPDELRPGRFAEFVAEVVADGRTPVASRPALVTAPRALLDRWRIRQRYRNRA